MVLLRSKEKIVIKLLDYLTQKSYTLNEMDLGDFLGYDHMKFAQLSGYSLSGHRKLSYVSDEPLNGRLTQRLGCRCDWLRIFYKPHCLIH